MREVPQYIRQLGMNVQGGVQLSNAQARITEQASDALGKFGADIYQRDVEIQKVKALSQMRTELARQYDQAQNDPAKLQQAQQGYRKGFLNGIKSPDLAAQFEAIYDTEASAHLAKATQVRKQIQDQEHEASILTLIQSSIDSGARYYDSVGSDIPEYVLGAERALGSTAVSFDELLNAKNSDGTYMFTPNQKVSYQKMLNDGIQKRAEQMRAARLEDMQLRQTDFAEWGEKNGLTPMQIAQIQIEEKRDYIDVIGNTNAKAFANAFKQAQTPEQLMQAHQMLKEKYGEYTPNAFSKIAQHVGDDKAAAVRLMMDSNAPFYSEQIQLLNEAANLKDAEIDESYKKMQFDSRFGRRSVDDIETIEEGVITNNDIDRMVRSMIRENRVNEAAAYRKQVERLAKMYRIRSPEKSVDESIDFANEYTLRSFKMGNINGVDYRIPAKTPKGAPIDAVAASVIEDAVKEKIDTLDMAVGGIPIRRRDGIIPFLSPNKDAFLFRDMTARNALVLDSEGAPAMVKIDDIIKEQSEEGKREFQEKVNRKREIIRTRQTIEGTD